MHFKTWHTDTQNLNPHEISGIVLYSIIERILRWQNWYVVVGQRCCLENQ